MATIKQVASLAGVSVATVSRVVNNNGYVSPERRAAVTEAMRQLDYKPSAVARSLRRQQSMTVGVLVPSLNQPFFASLAYTIERALFANDYRMMLCSSEENASNEAAYVEMLLRQRVDGVIVAPTGQGSAIIQPLLSRVPVILVDRDLPDLLVSRVLADHFAGGQAAMRHLIGLGHRRIAIIGGPANNAAMEERTAGALNAAREAAVPPPLVQMSALSEFEMGFALAHTLLAGPNRPTAIFALTDVVAIGILHAAAELGLSLPGQLSVIGFDDIPMAAYLIPPLTTIAQPIAAIGDTAVRLLLSRLGEGNHAPHHLVRLPMQLHVRASTALA